MRQINIKPTIVNTINFIENTVYDAGFKQVVIGVSGGVDSAVACSLAVKALGKDNVHALILPYKNKQKPAVKLARLLVNQLHVPRNHIYEINIGSTVDELVKQLNNLAIEQLSNKSLEKIRLGNLMVRVRMMILFDFAKKLPALVLGTENKSEYILGYFTRFGDEASDVEPIMNLYKTEVWEMAKYLSIPQEIINTAPTAGLWPGQTDEAQLGFSYKDADEILYGLYEVKLTEEQLVRQGIDKKTITKVRSWVKSVDFKHHLPHIAPEPKIK